MLTPFGKALRIMRMDEGELLKGMADRICVTPAYLSAIENGKKDPTAELLERLKKAYSLSESDMQNLKEAKAKTLKQINISFTTENEEQVTLMFARHMSSLSETQRKNIISILSSKEK